MRACLQPLTEFLTVRKIEGPHFIDRHVGQRVKVRRKFLKLSQKALADALEVSYQQIQKYEKGDNRISCSALYGIAGVLQVPIAFFFEGVPEPGMPPRAAAEAVAGYQVDPMTKPDVIKMAREFDRIDDLKVRKCLVDLAKSFANSAET